MLRSRAFVRAAGELVVIVVGVLIALAADRWIQAIDARADQRFYFQQLASDLRADSVALERALTFAASRSQTVLELLLYADDSRSQSSDPRRLARELHLAAAFGTPEFSTDTWEDLVSSGNVASISDDVVRADLSAYYNEIERIGRLFEGLAAPPTDLGRKLWELHPPLQSLAVLDAFLPEELQDEYQPTAEEADAFVEAVVARDDLLAAFAQMRRTWIIARNTDRALLDRATRLLQRLTAGAAR